MTVVVATRNRLPLLHEAVASVEAQTHADWELIIVDDASEDGTKDWLSLVSSHRVSWLRLDEHSERSVARNIGFSKAQGSFVLFLDDDDRLLPRALECLAHELLRKPDAVAAVGARLFFDSRGPKWQSYHPPVRLTRVVWQEAVAGWAPVHGQCLFRAAAVRACGGYDPRYSGPEDHALWLKLTHLGPVVLIPKHVLEYRIHSGQQEIEDVKAISLQIRREFVATLSEGESRPGERLVEAWAHWRTAVEAGQSGQFKAAVSSHLALISVAPRLLFSPVTGPLVAIGLLKALLGLIVGRRALQELGRLKARASRLVRVDSGVSR